jgi:hypothetical protein
VVAFVLVLALACASGTGPVGGNLVVRAAPPVLNLSNESPAAIYTEPMEATYAMLVNWAACSDPAHCNPIKPGETKELPYAQCGTRVDVTAGRKRLEEEARAAVEERLRDQAK